MEVLGEPNKEIAHSLKFGEGIAKSYYSIIYLELRLFLYQIEPPNNHSFISR
jgi:hypothetical protein